MVELDERVLSEARTRNTLSVDDLLRRVEQYHSADKPGAPEDTLIEYARALADTSVSLDARSEALSERETGITDGMVRRELNERLTDAESWVGKPALYEVDDGHVSIYPARWHDALGGTTDLTECITFIRDASAFQEARGIGTAEGIPEEIVTDVVTVIGDLDPDKAAARLEELKERGEIIEDAATGPSGGLRPRDAAENGASELPPVIDIRDALDEIEATAESGVTGEINGIRESLVEFSERDRAGQDSILSDIERRIIGMREQLGGDADRRAEGILNRIQTYRDTSTDDAETLSLSGESLLDTNGNSVAISDHHGKVATFEGTLVNGGSMRDAVVIFTIYANDGMAIKTIETQTVSLDPDERETVEQTIYVPENATSYAAAAFDADDTRTIGDERSES